jgi:protein O-GlcNAc transferase
VWQIPQSRPSISPLLLTAATLICAMVAQNRSAVQCAYLSPEETASAQLAHQGGVLLQNGDLRGAAEAFGKSVALSHNQSDAHTSIGLIYEQFHRPLDAIREFEAARQLQPQSPLTTYNLALAYFQAGAYGRTINLLLGSQKELGTSPEFCRLIGDAYDKSGKPSEGLPYLRRAVELNPSAPEDTYDLAIVMLEAGATQDARVLLQHSVAAFPSSANLHMALGIAEYLEGLAADAETNLRKAAELDRSPAEMYMALGDFYAGVGKTSEALSAYRRSISLDGLNAVSQRQYGVALSRAGELNEAIDCLQRSLHLDPKDAEAHYDLGRVLVSAGNLGGAKQAFEKAIYLDPEYRRAYYELALVMTKLGDRQKAEDSLRHWKQLDPDTQEKSRR